ncbi:MAG: RrF2 family transcriptional regulator [Deltaproteobacteria bacterium]|nr:RrF2 family transcriptional regulator [Deltaproteobacteria bacterium]
MVKLSTKSRYGARLLLDMARHCDQGPVQLGDIAKRQNISVKYLEQIIIPLKKAGLVTSLRGPKGGHRLARPPEEITIGEIVAILEEGAHLVDCLQDGEVCPQAETCPTRSVWEEATAAMFNALNAVTLADLVQRCAAVED